MPNASGRRTGSEKFDIPFSICWYNPKNISNVDELIPGMIKLIPHMTPQRRNPQTFGLTAKPAGVFKKH